MRVIMNGLAAVRPRTGVGHYVANLHALMPREVALYPEEPWSTVAKRAAAWFSSHSRGSGTPGSGRTSLREPLVATVKHTAKIGIGIHFARTAQSRDFELYHEPNFIPFSTEIPTVITVHDLSVLLHPEWHPADRVHHHERHFLPAVRRARHLITVSEAMRQEMIAHLGCSPERVTAVPNGVGPEYAAVTPELVAACRRQFELPDRYFLCVGTVEPRKNLRVVLEAFASLPATIRESCPLILAGPWGWKSLAEQQFFHDHARHVGARHLGYVPSASLPSLYRGATALLFPSFYEGFGLPPLEMLATGGTVVASSSALAVREVTGQQAIFCDAEDTEAWRAQMEWLATAPLPSTETRQQRVTHALQYSWSRTQQETYAVYEKTLSALTSAPANAKIADRIKVAA